MESTQGSSGRQNKMIAILQKIPIFKGFTLQQSAKILGICGQRKLGKNSVLCKAGDKSNEMYVLLQGLIKITLPNGKEVSRIRPVGIIGEMGVFTGELRSAGIQSLNESIILVIRKSDLFDLLKKDAEMLSRVLMNVIFDLSQKLQKNNTIVEELRKLVPPGESTMIISKVTMDTEGYRSVKS